MTISAAPLGYTPRERFAVTLSCILGYWLDFYNLVIIAFLMGAIQTSLSISLTQAGTITSLTLAGSVVGGVLFGWLGDRIGRRGALQLTLALFSGGAIISAFSWNYASLLVFRFVAGIGLGGEWGAGMVLLNEVWSAKRRGFGSGVVQAMAGAGVAAASVVAVWALTHFSPDWGWRIALLTGGAPVLLMIYIRIAMPESHLWREFERRRKSGELPPEKARQKSPLVEIFRGASGRYIVLGILSWGGYVIGYQSITVFMPVLMSRDLGATQQVVRSATLLYALFMSLCMLLVGWYSDRLGRKLGVLLPTVIAAISYVGLYHSGAMRYPGSVWVWSLFWWYMVFAVGQTSAPMFGCWLSELFPVEIRSTAVATVYTIGRGVGAIAPFVVPATAARLGGSLVTGMMFGLAGSLICLLATLFLPETAGRSFAVVEGKERLSPAAAGTGVPVPTPER